MRVVQLTAFCQAGCKYVGCEHILQEHSLPNAVARSTRWTTDEIALIKDTLNEPLPDIALVLGRTYYAVARARYQFKRGILKA